MTEKNSLENIDYDLLIKAYKYRLLVKESQKKYSKNHKDKINEIRRRCHNNKVINDPEYKIKKAAKARELYHKKKLEKEAIKLENIELIFEN